MRTRGESVERAALSASIVLGFSAGIWVLLSRELSDFLGEGPVRAFGLADGPQQALIAVAVLVLTAVLGTVTWAPLPLWRYGVGGLAMLVCIALAPPLFVLIAALYAVAFAAAVIRNAPRDRVDTLAPSRHPYVWTGASMVALAGLAVTVWTAVWLLRPLWDAGEILDERLAFAVPPVASGTNEPGRAAAQSPVFQPPSTGVQEAAPASQPAAVIAMGQLEGADSFHSGSGTVRLLRGPEGQLLLRFEDFEVRNGPDLFVYLTPDRDGDVGVKGALDLGAIRATRGNVNYEIPAGNDPATFRSAVIWCRSFDIVFAVATFE